MPKPIKPMKTCTKCGEMRAANMFARKQKKCKVCTQANVDQVLQDKADRKVTDHNQSLVKEAQRQKVREYYAKKQQSWLSNLEKYEI